MTQLSDIATAWVEPEHIERLGAGHIHDTYLVTGRAGSHAANAGEERFVLQRINETVFRDAALVIRQTERVLALWSDQDRYLVPELCRTIDGASLLRAGGAWRMWRYLDKTKVIDPVENTEQAFAAGQAFGAFQAQMRGLAGPRLHDTIEGFLQLSYYLEAYERVADKAPAAERALIHENRGLANALAERNAYIHGDCKINNLLFEQSSDACVAAIIDFDTVMYGHWAWDFGDLVRSVAFSQGTPDVDYFAACLRGFIAAQPEVAEDSALEEAVLAPGYVSLMLGVRFLTDHLSGDQYFRVARTGQNLERAREQFALFAAFQAQQDAYRDAGRELKAGLAGPR